MFEELKKIYGEVIGGDTSNITLKSKVSDLNLSSLGIINLVCEIEDKFDIEITNKELKSFKTLQDIVSLMERKIN